jgi:hypothetical protein
MVIATKRLGRRPFRVQCLGGLGLDVIYSLMSCQMISSTTRAHDLRGLVLWKRGDANSNGRQVVEILVRTGGREVGAAVSVRWDEAVRSTKLSYELLRNLFNQLLETRDGKNDALYRGQSSKSGSCIGS